MSQDVADRPKRRGPGRPKLDDPRDHRQETVWSDAEKTVLDALVKMLGSNSSVVIRDAVLEKADAMGIPVPRKPVWQPTLVGAPCSEAA